MNDSAVVEVKRTIVINNKHKRVYKEHAGYILLNEADQDFFDSLFPILWFNGESRFSNQFIGEKYGYSPSTVQKKLKRCQEQGLIYRQMITTQNEDTGRYTTDRVLMLDPSFKTWMMKELKLLPKGMTCEPEEAAEEIMEAISEIDNSFQSTGKNDKKKPILKKFRR